ncbi:hypothetical protein BT93_K0115 [Corymbia citriodora subsp. variegata]|nr:hypothetical protein BT93_K0115 [Corymbia citriodora subsp. variegata]
MGWIPVKVHQLQRKVAKRVAKGELDSAFAIVRPPGHHAEHDEAMGFCLYNNVAIATNFLLKEKELGINKILIVDWDVHHGNGTQKTFWKDPRVLFFSVHRHEFGSFYPANDDGDYTMIGEGPGAGYNINVPWENGRCGDADYLAVWDHILIPVAKQFNPDMILISAGFDAAVGDPLGGCHVTPYGYALMLKKLMDFARGKIVLALEGGYNLASISNSALACMEVLLDDKTVTGSTEAYPLESTWRVIQAVKCLFSGYSGKMSPWNFSGSGGTAAAIRAPHHQAVKKRLRTKFTQEQKEKMFSFAEKVGWKIQKQEESVVQQFCQEIGVKRRVLEVWMHNNKHNLAKKNPSNNNTPSSLN